MILNNNMQKKLTKLIEYGYSYNFLASILGMYRYSIKGIIEGNDVKIDYETGIKIELLYSTIDNIKAIEHSRPSLKLMNNLREMVKVGYRKATLAKLIGVSNTSLWRYLNEDNIKINYETAKKIEKVYQDAVTEAPRLFKRKFRL